MEEKQVYDLDALDTSGDIPYEFQVRNIEGELIDFWITVLGHDSDTYQTAFRQMQRRAAKKLKRNQSQSVDPEEIEANALELLATATKSWRGSVVMGGKPLPPCTMDEVIKMCKLRKHVREQIDAEVHNRANFSRQPAKS